MVGTIVGGFQLAELLHAGLWNIYRGQGSDGARAIVTVAPVPPPDAALEALALPFDGIPALRGTARVDGAFALIETAPPGFCIGDLRWPLPIDEVISVGLDVARLLARMHAAGVYHGSLRPQTTWIDRVAGRSALTGTTPRPELVGLPSISPTRTGSYSPFVHDMFYPDVLARGEPRGVSSDVAQLGMLLHRMAMASSPFAGGPDESMMQPYVRAIQGEIPPWGPGDARMRGVEELARAAFDPARAASRSLAPLLEGLERLTS